MPGMGKDFCKVSRLALGPAQPSTPLVPGVLSLWVKGQDKNLNTHLYLVSGLECVVLCLHCSICLHAVVLNYTQRKTSPYHFHNLNCFNNCGGSSTGVSC